MTADSAARPAPSDSQWDAIQTVDQHLLIAAGAGTGKTTTVVEKILFLLGVAVRGEVIATPMRLNDIAAITYTNKAAAELKAKLRGALRAAGRRADAYQVDSARVGTIHAFCGDILSEFSLRANRPPALALIDEGETAVIRSEVIREVLLERVADGSIPSLNELLSHWSVADVERDVTRLIEQGDHLRVLVQNSSACSPMEQALLRLAELAQNALTARLEAAGSMDFDRMITWTRDLIRDHPLVRHALQQRIKILVIDEFQDVDPVQREIAYLLGEPGTCRTDCTRLVLVGDPKQSIFRFRRADVTVWRSVERDFAEQGFGRVVELAENRRSVPGILGFVDHAIGKLLETPVKAGATELAEFEVEYRSLVPTRDTATESPVEIWVVRAQEGEIDPKTGKLKAAKPRDVATVRSSDARAMARRARELHDKNGVAWRDIAVLLTSWGDLSFYTEALLAEDIPLYALRTEGFYTRKEVVDVLVALEAIRSPGDDRVLMGFLRSPFVGLSDESLLRIARELPAPCWDSIGEVKLDDPDEAVRLTFGVATLRRFAALRDRLSVQVLLDELLLETGYCAHLALLAEDGKQRIANVRKLVRTAASMPDVGIGEFLRAVKVERILKTRIGDARLYGERDDVVTVTTVHSAKGLEWSVVFWCDLVRKPHALSDKLLIGRARIVLGDSDKAAEDQGDAWQALHRELSAEEYAEDKRLWYVAATRAKDLLILSGIPLTEPDVRKGKQKTPALSVANAIKTVVAGLDSAPAEVRYNAQDGAEYTAIVRILDVVEAVEAESVVGFVTDSKTLSAPHPVVPLQPGRARHSATELIALDRCGRRHWFKYVAGLREPLIATHVSAGEIDAITRGLIVHDILERASDDADLDVLLEAAIQQHDDEAPVPGTTRGDAYRLALSAEIEKVLALPEYRSLVDNPQSRRELKFIHIDAPGRFAEGAIDVCAPGDDGYTILDVKTSQCDAETATRKAKGYNEQRNAYVRAVEAISGQRVARFVLQFTAAAVQVGGAISADVREEGAVQLRRAIERISAGTREMTKHPHECRYCGYREVGWCEGVPQAQPSTRSQ